ncbi:hypothetical protein GOP47_0028574 [Adiantum capillus-veneris]|nr:hypothetical protein GOP47_0028574 [Adiantum capillus-veneris]
MNMEKKINEIIAALMEFDSQHKTEPDCVARIEALKQHLRGVHKNILEDKAIAILLNSVDKPPFDTLISVHVGRAEGAVVGRETVAMEGGVAEDGVDEEGVGVADDDELAVERVSRLKGRHGCPADGQVAQRVFDVRQDGGARLLVQRVQHGVQSVVPRHALLSHEALKDLAHAQLPRHPPAAVLLHQRLVEVQNDEGPPRCHSSLQIERDDTISFSVSFIII